MRPTRDELEFLISQHLDGTLNPVEQAALDEMLATDTEARAILAEYWGLNAIVKSALPAPDVDWDQFAARILAETAKCDAPVRHFKLRFGTVSKFAALAAMIAIAFGIAVKVRTQPGSTQVNPPAVAVNNSPIDVQISAPPAIASAPVSEISISQPSGLATADYHSAEAIISRPTIVNWIASGSGSGQDTDPTIY
jgi:anti-sigma factor RsiW